MELTLNASPITLVGPDSTELEALTRYHFLLSKLSVSFPSLKLDDSFDHRKRLVRAQAYANALWKR